MKKTLTADSEPDWPTPMNTDFTEANATDRGILQYAQREAGTSLNMIFVRSEAEAMAYLSGQGRFADRHRSPLPATIVIDLAKPRMNAWELVDWIKARPELSHIQICFIGVEDDEAAVLKAQPHGPCFFTKPEDTESYENMLRSLSAEPAVHGPH